MSRVRQALLEAVLATNAAWYALDPDSRPDVEGWTELEREVDAACASGNEARALESIAEWRDHHLALFAEGKR